MPYLIPMRNTKESFISFYILYHIFDVSVIYNLLFILQRTLNFTCNSNRIY